MRINIVSQWRRFMTLFVAISVWLWWCYGHWNTLICASKSNSFDLSFLSINDALQAIKSAVVYLLWDSLNRRKQSINRPSCKFICTNCLTACEILPLEFCVWNLSFSSVIVFFQGHIMSMNQEIHQITFSNTHLRRAVLSFQFNVFYYWNFD